MKKKKIFSLFRADYNRLRKDRGGIQKYNAIRPYCCYKGGTDDILLQQFYFSRVSGIDCCVMRFYMLTAVSLIKAGLLMSSHFHEMDRWHLDLRPVLNLEAKLCWPLRFQRICLYILKMIFDQLSSEVSVPIRGVSMASLIRNNKYRGS